MALTEKQIKKLGLKEKLEEERKNIKKQLDTARKSLDMGDDFGTAQEEEETDESTNFSNYIDVREMLDDRIDAIDEALNKIDEGTFGECEECDEDIPLEILKVNPESRMCIKCNKKQLKEKNK